MLEIDDAQNRKQIKITSAMRRHNHPALINLKTINEVSKNKHWHTQDKKSASDMSKLILSHLHMINKILRFMGKKTSVTGTCGPRCKSTLLLHHHHNNQFPLFIKR